MEGPLETRVSGEMPPVNPTAGPVRPVVVSAGTSATRVAIVDVDGLLLNSPFVGPLSLGENPVALFRERLDAAEADPCVKAVVLRINSHGGGVAACQTMRHDLERFKARCGKPVVACLLDTACGGAYYLASAADQVVAGEATVTGGIGV
ncbi:MAG TPA: S49 family peptidase, partial [Urbifossiella sp.]|nr:S49 family peptidase [Urbifossiella sp.]